MEKEFFENILNCTPL